MLTSVSLVKRPNWRSFRVPADATSSAQYNNARSLIAASTVLSIMTPEQQKFLTDECFSLTLMGTVQRGNLYAPNSGEAARNAFRCGLRAALEQLAECYHRPVSDDDHLANIVALADRLSASHSDALASGRFRIGSSQKALNLFLKYMWCLGFIPTPPHCPFDREIISRLHGYQGSTWTRLENLDDYKGLVAAARAHAKGIPLAEWELQMYNDG